MDTSRSERGTWTPKWQSTDAPYAVFVATSEDSGIHCWWEIRAGEPLDGIVAALLRAKLAAWVKSEMIDEANFLYVVLDRAPRPEDVGKSWVGVDTPFCECGFGSPGASPEELPVVDV